MGAILLLVLSLSPLSIGATALTPPIQISNTPGSSNQFDPKIAVDKNGCSHITWDGYHSATGTAQQISYADNTSET